MTKRVLLFFTLIFAVASTGFGQTTEVITDWETVSLDIGGSFSNGHFGDSTFLMVGNPNPSGINTSANVHLWMKANDAAAWGGFYIDLPEPLDLSGAAGELCFSVHADYACVIRLKIEMSNDEGPDASFNLDYTTPGEWQQLCYDLLGPDLDGNAGLTAGHSYTRIAIFPDRGGVPAEDSPFYFDDFVKTTGGDADAAVIANYEPGGITVPMGGSFGNGDYGSDLFDVVPNPSQDAVNSSSLAQEWCKADNANTWGGWFVDVDTIDFTGTKASVCVSIYAEEAGLLLLKLEGSATGPDVRIQQDYTTPGEWQELCFDFSQPDIDGFEALGHLYHRITFFPDFGSVPPADKCYHFDNIYKITNGGGVALEVLGNIIQSSPDHTILTNLINAADLWGEINANGVTVFAPTDDAINALPPDVVEDLSNNVGNSLYNVLLHHITYDSLPANFLTQDMHIITRNGQDAVVTAANQVDGANITTPDVLGVNGILHVVDAVMMPMADPPAYMYADYESPELSPFWTYFNTNSNTSFAPVANPAPGGINTSDKVGIFIKYPGGAAWQGMHANPARPLNLINDMTEVCFKVLYGQVGTMRLKVEQPVTGGPIGTFETDVTAANEWQEVCFGLTQEMIEGGFALGHIYNRMTVFFDRTSPVPEQEVAYYFDDIVQKNTIVGTRDITRMEGFRFYPNPASDWVTVESETPIFSAFVYDIAGRQLLRALNPVEAPINVSSLNKGMYFIQFRDASNHPLGTVKFVKQ